MLVKIYGAAVQGIDAIPVTIEVVAEVGFSYTMVGLPDTAVKESYQRVMAAMQQSGIEFPRRRLVMNLSPADVRKEGAAYVYAPQKGANSLQVIELDNGLRHYAQVIKEYTNMDISQLPGAGAAGGIDRP